MQARWPSLSASEPLKARYLSKGVLQRSHELARRSRALEHRTGMQHAPFVFGVGGRARTAYIDDCLFQLQIERAQVYRAGTIEAACADNSRATVINEILSDSGLDQKRRS